MRSLSDKPKKEKSSNTWESTINFLVRYRVPAGALVFGLITTGLLFYKKDSIRLIWNEKGGEIASETNSDVDVQNIESKRGSTASVNANSNGGKIKIHGISSEDNSNSSVNITKDSNYTEKESRRGLRPK